VFPDYRERVVRHESAHFLVGYLCGIPITNYSVGIGSEHVAFAEAKLQVGGGGGGGGGGGAGGFWGGRGTRC